MFKKWTCDFEKKKKHFIHLITSHWKLYCIITKKFHRKFLSHKLFSFKHRNTKLAYKQMPTFKPGYNLWGEKPSCLVKSQLNVKNVPSIAIFKRLIVGYGLGTICKLLATKRHHIACSSGTWTSDGYFKKSETGYSALITVQQAVTKAIICHSQRFRAKIMDMLACSKS